MASHEPTGHDPDTAHWREAIALFEALAGADDATVAARLAASSPPVQERVRRMLDAGAAPGPLDRPLAGAAPETLGRWRLGEVIGRGGMSVVYRAESLAPPVGQPAAVKVLALPAPDAAGQARFQREMDILVRLRHPAIAPLLDAGVGPDGRPWFAMALVEGQAIDAWCEAHALGVAARVRLFGQVVQAVAHAHRHLVVHRDIKPGNVMVDADGRAVLLDFGISRVLEDGAAELTSAGSYPFTPRYAAPEQRQGGLVSTATDVYGLGALLHKLLLGRPPGGEPADGATDTALPADLRAVLARALDADPARRYASAEALGADLDAWAEGRPVRARAGGIAYRAGRWARRNPALAGLSLALALSVLAGTGASLWQAREARAQAAAAGEAQARAESALARAEAVRDYVALLFEAADPSRGEDARAGELLAAGEAQVDDALEQGRPDVAVDLLRLLGDARTTRGEYDQAIALYERALALAGREPARVPASLRWPVAQGLAGVLRTRGQATRSVALLAGVLAEREAAGLAAADRLALEVALMLAESTAERNEEALARGERLLAGIEDSGAAGTEVHLNLLEGLSTIRALLRLPDDRALFEQRLAVAAKVYAGLPGWLAFTYADAVPTLRRWRDFARAQELADAAVAITEPLYDAPNVIAAIVYCNAGTLALDRGRTGEALAWLDRSIAIDQALARRHTHALSCLLSRAEARATRRDRAGALADLDAAAAMGQALDLPADSRWHGDVCAMAARASLVVGDDRDAAARLRACPAAAGAGRVRLVRAELALRRGDLEAAAADLGPTPEDEAPPRDAPAGLRPWRLRLALAQARDPAGAEPLRRQLAEAVAAIPGPWDERDALLACLAPGARALDCPGAP